MPGDGSAPSWRDVNVLGVPIAATHIPELIQACDGWIARGESRSIAFTSVHGIMESHDDPVVRKSVCGVSVRVPDGMPLVVIGRRLQKERSMERCYGPDFMLAAMEQSVAKGHRHYLFGGNEGVAEMLKAEMETRFPGVQIVGTHTPPFRPLSESELGALSVELEELRPDCFWIGISTPKQETFMYENLKRLPVTLMFGVGAAFDFHTGRVRQAPAWMQRCCLEWLFRALCEPRRLMPRFLKHNPRFLWYFFLQSIGARRYTLTEGE